MRVFCIIPILLIKMSIAFFIFMNHAIAADPQFILKPEWTLQNMPEDFVPGKVIDVNLGHTYEKQIQAVWFQLTGTLPSMEELGKWQSMLKKNPRWRRIDLAVKISESLGKTPQYSYSDPWQKQQRLLSAPEKKIKRDIGAVCMYFFRCPNGVVNAKLSWANNHAPGMKTPAEICKIKPSDSGYYNPKNPGFWLMELLDARYAGLQFLLLNTYGPDLEEGKLKPINEAFIEIEKMGLDKTVKIGLFDDTWSWGKPYFKKSWEQIPDMNYPEKCAKMIFEAKWKPFFKTIPRKHWYLVKGKPMIYFYNGGTIKNKKNSAQVFKQLKQMFKDEFGVEPYLCSDSAFWELGTARFADNKFRWFFIDKNAEDASFTKDGVTLTHAMVRWDDTARLNKQQERAVIPEDKIYKDDILLKRLLNETKNSDILVIATWNDLGEGTGINRCVDYYWDEKWQKPTHFMDLIRTSQEGGILK